MLDELEVRRTLANLRDVLASIDDGTLVATEVERAHVAGAIAALEHVVARAS